jgi:2'-5' RNA ligase
MAYAVVFYFDKNSENPIYKIWEQLEKIGLSPSKYKSGIRPHITLAIYDSINCIDCEINLKNLVADSKIFSVQANHLGIFSNQTSVIFIAPASNIDLLEFQKGIHQALEDSSKGAWEIYIPGNWIPHCTLAQGVDSKNLSVALKICVKMKLPLELRISQVGIVEFEPIIPLLEIDFPKT